MEFNWTIPMTEYSNDDDKGIVVAHWRVSAEDGNYTASAYGTAGFTPNPDAAGFVPYADLTEADVLAWVWASVDKDEMEANLAKQIEDQKAPATQSGLPWA
jgi:hypothetical protein